MIRERPERKQKREQNTDMLHSDPPDGKCRGSEIRFIFGFSTLAMPMAKPSQALFQKTGKDRP
jgi:hypothetical protein